MQAVASSTPLGETQDGMQVLPPILPPRQLGVVVLVSGNGSNLQVLIDAMQADTLPIEIVGVISNQADAYAIARATKAGITTAVLSHTDSGKRMSLATFERHALAQIEAWQADLVVLAGFMRVLSAGFIQQCTVPMLNLHPSLLPRYKGLDTHARVLRAGEREHGCSVHLVTAELDAGQVLTQAVLSTREHDTAVTLGKRVQRLEHQLLPWTLGLIAHGVLLTDVTRDKPQAQHPDRSHPEAVSSAQSQADSKVQSQTESITSALPCLPLPWRLYGDDS